MTPREQASPAIYVTMNALMTDHVTLDSALRMAREAGADGVELRHELLAHPLLKDLHHLRSQLERFPFPPVYSTPHTFFSDGHVLWQPILHILAEAQLLDCHVVKFSAGTLSTDEVAFAALLAPPDRWQNQFPNMKVTIENDQSSASGNIANWELFFERATMLTRPIWMTFDLGNWTCVGCDVMQAARALGRYVAYIHVKAVEQKDGQCISQPIHAASTPHPALAYLPSDVPRSIEFPITESDEDSAIAALRAYITLVRSGNFTT